MRHHDHNQTGPIAHAAARLLLLLCLWMGTGGVLHHTDDLAGLASMAQRAAVGNVAPAAPPDDCAACQWTQGLQTGPPVSCPVVLPLASLTPVFFPVPQRLLPSPPTHRSPRAPPITLS